MAVELLIALAAELGYGSSIFFMTHKAIFLRFIYEIVWRYVDPVHSFHFKEAFVHSQLMNR